MIRRESLMGSCRASSFVLLAILLLAGGTACSNSEPLYPVSGKVMFRNQPLPDATVTFVPDGPDKLGIDIPVGKSGADGSFSLKSGEREGAAAGKYKVTIVCMATPTKPAGDGMSMSAPEPVDRLGGLFANPSTSKFSIEVKEGTNELEPFQLQ